MAIGLAVILALVAKAMEPITHPSQNHAESAMLEMEGFDLYLMTSADWGL